MSVFLSANEIADLLAEAKTLPADWLTRLALRPKRGHKERELDLRGEKGSQFRLILRQADLNQLDFSVILALLAPNTNQVFRLLRCNGKSHEHTNRIEQETFYDFHVHRATERYQQDGCPEDGYAEVTTEYADFAGALDTVLSQGGFVRPKSDQLGLFDGGKSS